MISGVGGTRPLCFSAALMMTALGVAGAARQGTALRIVSPTTENIVSGPTRIQVVIEPEAEIGNVKTITYSVNGRLACTRASAASRLVRLLRSSPSEKMTMPFLPVSRLTMSSVRIVAS